MRHVNPVRQSGPIPPYSGTYTMEDMKAFFDNTTFGKDYHYCQMDIDEVMRRVPGVTKLLNLDHKKRSRAYCKTWTVSPWASRLRVSGLQSRLGCFLHGQRYVLGKTSGHQLKRTEGWNLLEYFLLGRSQYVECELLTRLRKYGLPLVNIFVGWSPNKSHRRSGLGCP